MKKILLTFTNVSWQKGSAAQVFTFVREMRKLDNNIDFILLSHCYELDNKPASGLGIKLAGLQADFTETSRKRSLRLFVIRLQLILWAGFKKMGINIRRLVNNPIAIVYMEADIIADFSGDSYRDPPGGVSIAHNVNLIVAKMLKKPIVLISQSIGPFRWYGRWLSRQALNWADLIYIREGRTRSILTNLKVQSKIALAPDIAFMLTRYSDEKLLEIYNQEGILEDDRKKRMFGISISNLMCHFYEKNLGYDYMGSMAHIINYLNKAYGATVVLIPHEIKPVYMGSDDRVASHKLAERLQYPSWLKLIRCDYDPSEIKTLISSLEMLIAARLHAGIAGLSSNIPTVLLSWSHKYIGLLEEIGIPECVWDGNNQSIHELESLCDKVIQDKESIKQTLTRYNLLSQNPILVQLCTTLRILNKTKLSPKQAFYSSNL